MNPGSSAENAPAVVNVLVGDEFKCLLDRREMER